MDNQNQSRIYDGLCYWEYDCAKIEVKNEGALSPNSNYVEISVREQAFLINKGFNGLHKHAGCCAMSIEEGDEYQFSCCIRNVSFDGRIQVRVLDEGENPLTGTQEIPATDIKEDWSNIVFNIPGIADGNGKLNILFLGDDMKPLPTLSAGINCQIREMTYRFYEEPKPVDSDYFQKEIVQNYLDLIKFANGKPEDGPWAKLRADMGHPKPFGLEMTGIGNENYGKAYRERFTIIRNAIKEKYLDIKCIISAGYLPQKPFVIPTWNFVYSKHPDVIVDGHSYHSPQWFEKQVNRYRYYRRRSAKVYVGEYSANGMMAGKKMTADNSNCFDSAFGEAAFLTGVERNGDVVDMASFAPLFNLVDSDQWFSNLIDFSPKSVCPGVNYYTQKLFMNYTGDIPIAFKAKLLSHVYVTFTRDQKNL